MKTKFIKTAFGIAIASLLTSSCGDFLEESSQDEFKPESVSAYQELLNGEGYALTTTIDPISHLFTDDVKGVKANYNSYYTEENLAMQDVFAWQPDMDQSLKDKSLDKYYQSYQDLYHLVMVCNTVLEGVDKVDGTNAERAQTRGEALALRAYYYWYLVNLYAMPYNMAGTTPDKLQGVPLVLTSEIRDEGPKRATVAQVYEQMTKDIEEACTLLETTKSTNISKFRINYVAANLLASRIYLYMEEWDKVIEHAGKALEGAPSMCNLNSYALTPSSNIMNSTNNFISSNFPETIFCGGNRSNFVSVSATLICPSDELINSFSADDKRLGIAFMAQSWAYWKQNMIKFGAAEQGYAWRTAELYLNRAEAYAEKFKAGDAASGEKAVNDINVIRQNRIATASYKPYTLGSADDLIQFIRDERRRELCFENPHRWFDLKRYGMPELKHTWVDATGNRTTYTLEKNDVGYALPIPTAATTANSNLEQNPLHAVRKG